MFSLIHRWLPSLAACQNSNATRKAWATVKVTAWAWQKSDREINTRRKRTAAVKTGSDCRHTGVHTRTLSRTLAISAIMCLRDRRIRDLSARTKRLRGRKRRERLAVDQTSGDGGNVGEARTRSHPRSLSAWPFACRLARRFRRVRFSVYTDDVINDDEAGGKRKCLLCKCGARR